MRFSLVPGFAQRYPKDEGDWLSGPDGPVIESCCTTLEEACSAEARGAARKWGPEYWCAWNAHEWQTCGLPYRTEQKYDSCLVGFLRNTSSARR